MIVPMKKVAVLVLAKDAKETLRRLRSLGVLHLEHQKPPTGKDIASLKDDVALLEKVNGILSSPEFRNSGAIKGARLLKDWKFSATRIVDIHARLAHLEEYGTSLSLSISQWEPWGEFDPKAFGYLAENGVYVRLIQLPESLLDSMPSDLTIVRISVVRGTAYCAVISPEMSRLPFKDTPLPKMGLNEMKARLSENEEMKSALRKAIRRYASFAGRFSNVHHAFLKELELHEAVRGMGSSEGIDYVVGYVPFDVIPTLSKEAAEQGWGLSVSDPSDEDVVPTLVRNPRWISVIRPMFKLIEIVPGYKELDISPVFLLALSLFFGMIIGDAGYGAIYIIATFFAQKRFGGKTKDHRLYFLLYLFSASAVLWGVLTGTVFGQEWYLKAGFKPLAGVLNDTKFLQAFCFFIGALHLTVAQGWQALKKLPSPRAIADLGWISVLWAAFFIARMLILSDPLPSFCRWLIIVGAALIVLGTNPQRNIFKMVAEGLGAVALNIVNSFTDVVSYIRLFAVGLAGVAISDTVNSLASGFPGNFIAQFFILLLGHTINIFLGPMSVLVHGVRLNVLEFSSHAGLSWSGTAYKPLER